MSSFSEVFSRLVKEYDLSLLSLEKKIGISNAQLGRYMSGHYEPSLKNAIIIAKYFSCSLDYLCGLDNVKFRYEIKRDCNVDLFIERYNTLLREKPSNANRISKELNFSRNCTMRWRKNKNLPTLSILIKLSGYFNVPIEFLVGRVDV